jgi:hypothetical protein
VRAVLDLTRRTTHAPAGATDESLPALATRALMQSGFSPTLASHAVALACERVDTDDLATLIQGVAAALPRIARGAHVGTDDLITLIKAALRHCRESRVPTSARMITQLASRRHSGQTLFTRSRIAPAAAVA